ncbi:MAG: FHA domain-containing protein [Lachnospiraceae bacterium]|nr:FHA domain-containing protein [Candidatus Colinaster scatohippi]
MEIVQEMGRSCLIIEDKTPEELRFMRQMLTYNRISGIIACQKGLYNNRDVLKYDVTNMRPLSRAYEIGQMSYDDIRKLFCGINDAIKKGRAFLFDDNRYLMMPEHIYISAEDEKIFLVYIPFDEEKRPISELNGRFYELADFLIGRVNHKDDKGVSVAYQFYRMCKDEFFSLDAFESVIEKENDIPAITKKNEKSKSTLYLQQPALVEEEREEYDYEDNESKIGFVPVIICISAMAIIGLITFFWQQARQYLYQIIIVECILGGGCIFYIVYKLIKARLATEYDDLMSDERVTLEEFWSVDDETQFFDEDHTEMLSSDETQFFDEEDGVRHTITWEEDGNTRIKEIRKEDNILGKKFDEVDLCITDPSISRRHARLIIGKKGSFLQDLDSTNGTFVNGNRLMPGENVKIDETSEIRFGKVTVSVV